MQQRLRRFVRQPERLSGRQVTSKSLAAVAIIERYRFLPTSLLVRLMPGDQKNNHRHLQTLFHRGLVNRFCLPKYGGPGEFIYYLDSQHALSTLAAAGLFALQGPERQRREAIIRYNRENSYARLHHDIDNQGKVLYIQHELMISRFHALLELACRQSTGSVRLEQWKQGSELWRRVEAPAVREQEYGELVEISETEFLPHRPDAFFQLRFVDRPDSQQLVSFLYEADRGTENTTRFKMKLRAHWHFTVAQKLQRQPPYDVPSIRAVLTESQGMQWAHNLREAAKHPIVSPNPSPLFWFTTSELLTKPVAAGKRAEPLYLQHPECIFERIWASPVEDTLLTMAD